MSHENAPYRLLIHGRDKLQDPEFIADLVDLGIDPWVANASTKVAWCLGLSHLTTGTLEELSELQDALAARGYESRIQFRDRPRLYGSNGLDDE